MRIDTRQSLLLKLTRKLVLSTCLSLGVILFLLYWGISSSDRSYLALLIFATGLIGGFVSIQQRVHKISDLELRHLSESWASILLIPIYGGIFAVIIHILFLAGIVTGSLFPAYSIPKFGDPVQLADFQAFFTHTLPKSGEDTAKMIFWAFVAGFSERLVPQIIQNVQSQLIDQLDGDVPDEERKASREHNERRD